MKGMVAGEPIKSMGPSKAYDEGHEKTFGKPDPAFPRGRRFVWSTTEKRLVPAGLVQEAKALDAPVLAGRFYENVATPEGVDIGSRRRRRDYMKTMGYADADDFKGSWAKRQEERKAVAEGHAPDKTRRDDVGRALHRLAPE